jgi:hypothetical protein
MISRQAASLRAWRLFADRLTTAEWDAAEPVLTIGFGALRNICAGSIRDRATPAQRSHEKAWN